MLWQYVNRRIDPINVTFMAIKTKGNLGSRLSPSLKAELRDLYFNPKTQTTPKERSGALIKEFWNITSVIAPKIGTGKPDNIWITDSIPSMRAGRKTSALCIPESIANISQSTKEVIVAHELEHMKNKDGMTIASIHDQFLFAGPLGASVSALTMFYLKISEHEIAEVVGKIPIHFSNPDVFRFGEAAVVGAAVGYAIHMASRPVIMFVSRRQELRADIASVKAVGSATTVIGAFMEYMNERVTLEELSDILRIDETKTERDERTFDKAVKMLKWAYQEAVMITNSAIAETTPAYVLRIAAEWYGWLSNATHPSTERRIRNVLEYAARHNMEK